MLQKLHISERGCIMPGIELNHPRRRTTVRRAEDRLLRKQIDHYIQLFHIGQFIIEKKARHCDNMNVKKAAQRGRRSVLRLMDLQEKVDDIIQLRPIEENIWFFSELRKHTL
jgi:hypothetical protein